MQIYNNFFNIIIKLTKLPNNEFDKMVNETRLIQKDVKPFLQVSIDREKLCLEELSVTVLNYFSLLMQEIDIQVSLPHYYYNHFFTLIIYYY